MKNLRLKKTDVVRVIKDIWREKASEDEKVASINSVPVGIKKIYDQLMEASMYVLVMCFPNTDG